MRSKNAALLAQLPKIPDYYSTYVDMKINLENTPTVPCPFHGEQNGRSFSYSRQLGIWRCFGACHRGGDVIDLHMLNYKLKSYEEAAKSLCHMVGVKFENTPTFQRDEYKVDENDVYRRRLLANACELAKIPDDYIELDYIVSKYPYDARELETFCNVRGRLITKPEGGLTV